MTAPKKTGVILRFQQQGIHIIDQLDKRSHGWLSMLVDAARETFKPTSAITAAAIAFFATFSLFPLTLLSIAIASLDLGGLMDQHLIVQKLEFIAPALGQLLGKNIDEIIQARGSVTLVAIIGLIWSASTVFYTLTQTLNDIWGIKQRRSFWKTRGLAIILILVFVGPVLLLASIAGSLITSLGTWLPDQIIPFGSVIGPVVAVLLDIALFMTLYIVLPHAATGWREILPGAIAAGLLWELAKKTFLFFISTYISVSNLVYGSVAAIIAFLVWAQLSGLIFLFGAYLSVSFSQRRKKLAATVYYKDYFPAIIENIKSWYIFARKNF
jgi:membrane protein